MRRLTFLFMACTFYMGCSRDPGPDRDQTSSALIHPPAEVPPAARQAPSPSTEPPLVEHVTALETEDDPPDPEWRQIVFYESDELINKPKITLKSIQGSQVHLTAENTGDAPVQYLSGPGGWIQIFREVHDGTRWVQSNWDWCGTGKKEYEISPGETVDLIAMFRDDSERERLLACFSEEDSNRFGLVVLATESDQPLE